MELVTHPLSLIELEDRKKIRKSTFTASGDGQRNENASDNELVVFPPLQSRDAPSDGAPLATTPPGTAATPPSRTRTTLVIVILTGVSFLNTMGSGILTVALPRISTDLGLNESLLFWPASVYALAAGCTLLLFGSLADVVGGKRIWLTGSIMYTFLTLGCGLARTAIQLILFRTLLGLAISMCLPAAVSLMTRTCPPGRRRNIGFASMGMGQPLGYAVGLVLGGVFVDTIGWRFGYYISAVLSGVLSVAAIWGLPATAGASHSGPGITFAPWYKELVKMDWLGVVLISTSFALLSYVLAEITENYQRIKEVYLLALLTISAILLPVFGLWEARQERRGKAALIPNSLWRNTLFTTTCVAVFFSWAAFNACQYFSSLFFQRIQSLSALETSARYVPMVVVGAATNVVTGFLVDKVQVRTLVVTSAVLTAISPLCMATTGKPGTGYWRGPFEAMFFMPLHADVLFTVSNLIISQAFPNEKQSLAGGVFNSVAQIGNSVGLAVSAAIAASVTDHHLQQENQNNGDNDHDHDPQISDLNQGYQAAFWLMFAAMVVVCLGSLWGFRAGGKVGKKFE